MITTAADLYRRVPAADLYRRAAELRAEPMTIESMPERDAIERALTALEFDYYADPTAPVTICDVCDPDPVSGRCWYCAEPVR